MLSPKSIISRARRDVRIGIGNDSDNERVGDSILNALAQGFEHVTVYDDPLRMVKDLADGRIDAAIRGNLPARDTMDALRSEFDVPTLERIALLETINGRSFFLGPVGIDEGATIDDKVAMVKHCSPLLETLGESPRVAVISGGRKGDRGRSPEVDRTLDLAEQTVARLTAEGIDAFDCEILVERAVKDANIVLAPDGITGNLIFRTLHFLGNGRALGAPVVNIPKVFVDTSRAKTDYIDSIALASVLSKGF